MSAWGGLGLGLGELKDECVGSIEIGVGEGGGGD